MTAKLNFFFAIIITLLMCSCITTGQEPDVEKTLICYYNSLSYYREGLNFQPSDITDPFLCDIIIYTYMGMREESNKIYSKNPSLDFGPGETNEDDQESIGDLDMIRETISLREKNPNLKVLISVGGPEQSSLSFSNMARHIANRTVFVQSTMRIIELYELDGLDFYWKYPSLNGGREEDVETFVKIMKDLRTAFTNLTTFTGREYILTATLGCTENVIDVAYDMVQLSEYVDYFPLLCYDYKIFTPSTKMIAHHSPLFSKENDTLEDKKLNVAFGVNYLLEKGALPEKIILGISSHASTYELSYWNGNNIGQQAEGPGLSGKYLNQTGFLSYFEICDAIKYWPDANDPEYPLYGWQFKYDHESKAPYTHNGLYFIAYDNEKSAKEKVDFAMMNSFGGIMVEIDLDDYSNLCEGWNSYPITTAIKERLGEWENGKIKVTLNKRI